MTSCFPWYMPHKASLPLLSCLKPSTEFRYAWEQGLDMSRRLIDIEGPLRLECRLLGTSRKRGCKW
jgi:hypothetical protein